MLIPPPIPRGIAHDPGTHDVAPGSSCLHMVRLNWQAEREMVVGRIGNHVLRIGDEEQRKVGYLPGLHGDVTDLVDAAVGSGPSEVEGELEDRYACVESTVIVSEPE